MNKVINHYIVIHFIKDKRWEMVDYYKKQGQKEAFVIEKEGISFKSN